MSVEHQENKPRAYQRFLPGEFRKVLGIKNPEVVGINPQKSQELIESLAPEKSPRFRGRIIGHLKRKGIQTHGDLAHLDLDRPPRGIGKQSIAIIQKAREKTFLIEKIEEKPTKVPAPEISPKDPLAVLNLSGRVYNALRRAGIATIEDLRDWDWSKPPRRIGKKSLQEIEKAIGKPLRPKKVVIFEVPPPKPPPPEIFPPQELKSVLEIEKGITIDRLNLNKRVYNALRRANISTIEELLTWDWSQPPRRIGKKSLQEIKEAFSQPLRPKKEEVLTSKQFAEAIQVPLKTVYNWAKQGLIGSQPAHWKRWRFTQEDLKWARELKKGQEREAKREARRMRAREKLVKLRKALRRTKFPKKSLGLRETAKFLSEIGQELAIKPSGYPSHRTLEKLLKTAVILGNFPLPPEAVRVTYSGFWLCSLTKRNLATVLDVNLEILKNRNLTLEKAFRQAKKTFKEEREKRIPVENLFGKIKARKIIIENLQQGKLPLRFDVKPQEILILGILLEDKDDFINSWTEFIQKKGLKVEELIPFTVKLKTWPSLTSFLKEQLGLEKVNPWRLADGVAWLKEEEILITTIQRQIRGYLATYYRPSPQEQEQLKALLAIPEKKEKLKQIISKISKTEIPKAPRKVSSYFSLHQRGELSPLRKLLMEAGFEKVPSQKIGRVYDFLKEEVEIRVFPRRKGKTYQLFQKDKEKNLKIIKENWQEIEKLLFTP